MLFSNRDRTAICDILNLDRQQYSPHSLLATLLQNVEQFDAQNGTDVVTRVQAMITQIQDTDAALYGDLDAIDIDLGKTKDDGVQSLSIPGELTVAYGAGSSSSTPYSGRIDALKARLKTLIDPDERLGSVTAGGRILW